MDPDLTLAIQRLADRGYRLDRIVRAWPWSPISSVFFREVDGGQCIRMDVHGQNIRIMRYHDRRGTITTLNDDNNWQVERGGIADAVERIVP